MEFNFNQYEQTQKYFYFFDTYIKNNNDKKEELFEKLNITGSTYRRARNSESKAGKMVIKSLTRVKGILSKGSIVSLITK